MNTSWPFCPYCGTIMDPPDTDYVECIRCHFKCNFEELHLSEIFIKSQPRKKAIWVDQTEELSLKLKGNESVVAENSINNPTIEKHAKIEEPCPKCAHPELYFYTMQLRSVDEGSTVFYECPKCSHKFSQNN